MSETEMQTEEPLVEVLEKLEDVTAQISMMIENEDAAEDTDADDDDNECTSEPPVAAAPIVSPIVSSDKGLRHEMLESKNMVGYGAGAEGGEREIVVKNLKELGAAIQKPNSYIIIDPVLKNTSLKINDTLKSKASKLSIDASQAEGFELEVGPDLKPGRGLMWLYGNDIIVHDFKTRGHDFQSKKNQGALRFYGQEIVVSNITGTGFDDDFINLIGRVDFVTVVGCYAYKTHKSVFTFNTHNPKCRVTVTACILKSKNRKPWISSGRCHSYNNLIGDGVDATRAGRRVKQKNKHFNHNGPAFIISQQNVFEDVPNGALKASPDDHIQGGHIQSVKDNLNGLKYDKSNRVTFSDRPSLFKIPYEFEVLDNSQVKKLVEQAGAS